MIATLLALLTVAQPYDLSESCKIVMTGHPDQWRFIKVYDARSGAEFMSTVVKSGKPKSLYGAPPQIRIEAKFAGDTKFTPGPAGRCADGNTIAF